MLDSKIFGTLWNDSRDLSRPHPVEIALLGIMSDKKTYLTVLLTFSKHFQACFRCTGPFLIAKITSYFDPSVEMTQQTALLWSGRLRKEIAKAYHLYFMVGNFFSALLFEKLSSFSFSKPFNKRVVFECITGEKTNKFILNMIYLSKLIMKFKIVQPFQVHSACCMRARHLLGVFYCIV